MAESMGQSGRECGCSEKEKVSACCCCHCHHGQNWDDCGTRLFPFKPIVTNFINPQGPAYYLYGPRPRFNNCPPIPPLRQFGNDLNF